MKAVLRSCERHLENGEAEEEESLHTRACSLEERWHHIGLRALEWQYFLEGLTWTEDNNSNNKRTGANSRLSDRGKPVS